MSSRFDQLPNRRAIIDRRSLADALGGLEGRDATALRNASTALLKPALEAGRAEIAARLIEHPQAGREAASGMYLYRLEVDGVPLVGKMVNMK